MKHPAKGFFALINTSPQANLSARDTQSLRTQMTTLITLTCNEIPGQNPLI
jgi:hypothetical protein